MLQKFEIHGVHTDVDDNLHKYVTKKIGGLDRYLSRHDRESAHAQVYLKEGKAKDKCRYTCEVKLMLPKDTIVIRECTINLFAAVDIVESKLKQQLKKHKDMQQNGKMHRHMFGRLRRRELPVEAVETASELTA